MPPGLIVILFVISLGAWFLLGEQRSIKEKFQLIFVLVFLYIFCMAALGARTPQEIFAPFLKLFNTAK